MLKIEGDLSTMEHKWTATEQETGRRLVQFRRSQAGSIITATFEPVTLEDRIPNSICVSCIWWEEKRECYVTSVDTISLLESLVAVRFTVEEKNRIRRNLEGFRPATVSKTKADSEDFFKLIMGFPNPKPRNIEKDVKVFPWRILAGALKKIIGKYVSHHDIHHDMQPTLCINADHHTSLQATRPPPAPCTLPAQAPARAPATHRRPEPQMSHWTIRTNGQLHHRIPPQALQNRMATRTQPIQPLARTERLPWDIQDSASGRQQVHHQSTRA